MAQTVGLGAEPPADFSGFHIKKHAFQYTIIKKGRTVPAVSVVSNRWGKNILVGLSLPKSLAVCLQECIFISFGTFD